MNIHPCGLNFLRSTVVSTKIVGKKIERMGKKLFGIEIAKEHDKLWSLNITSSVELILECYMSSISQFASRLYEEGHRVASDTFQDVKGLLIF